jgi:hypothetical protein
MKKLGVILLLSILLLNLLTISIIAQVQPNLDPEDPLGVGINPEDIVDKDPEQLKNQTKNYLKKEWTEILEKYPIGKPILALNNILKVLNPFWKVVLGIEYSLSWAFIFAISIWFTLFLIIQQPMKEFFNNKLFGIAGGFLVASIIGASGVIRKALDLLSFIVKNQWIAWLSLAIAIIIMYVIVKLNGGLQEYLKKEAEDEKSEKAKKTIQTHGKVSEKELDSYSEK